MLSWPSGQQNPGTSLSYLAGPPSPQCCGSQPGSHGRHCMCTSPRPWAAGCGSTVCHLETGAHGGHLPALGFHSWREEDTGRAVQGFQRQALGGLGDSSQGYSRASLLSPQGSEDRHTKLVGGHYQSQVTPLSTELPDCLGSTKESTPACH